MYIAGLTKLAVFTGHPGADPRVFVIDLENPNNVCKNLANITVDVYDTSGILFDDSLPMFCGGQLRGHGYSCDCFAYKQSEWVSYPGISPCRGLSASAAFIDQENGKNTFVIAGGSSGIVDSSKVESFDGETWNSLPNLTSQLSGHCMVAINDTVLLSMGGFKYPELTNYKTYFFNSELNEWSPGPNLNRPRRFFSCTTVNWKSPSDGQQEKVVVVVGGIMDDYTVHQSSIELLFINNLSGGWQFGPELSEGVFDSVLIEYKDSVVLVGGDGGVDGKHLYQLSSPDGQWIEMEQTLPIQNKKHIAFLIPDDITDCLQAA